jgi:hypothetical protein
MSQQIFYLRMVHFYPIASLVITVTLCTTIDDKYIPVNRKLKFALVIFIRKFLGNPIPLHMQNVLYLREYQEMKELEM